MFDIRARTALVTGASAGVGLAVSRRLLQFGANVVLCARDPDRLAEAASALNAPQRVLALPWDVADTGRAPDVLDHIRERFGSLSILVNNAGVNHRGDFASLEPAQLAAVIDLNLRAPMILTRLALPMIRSSGQGAIVNVASLAGRVPLAHEVSYSASKFGLRAFSLALAQELAGSGVSASVVSPGPIDTGFIMDAIDEVPDIVFSQPMSTAEEVAEAVMACIRDGRPERALPVASGVLSHIAYLFPWLAERIRPALEARGRRAKAIYRARREIR
jgi:hypothetical protein